MTCLAYPTLDLATYGGLTDDDYAVLGLAPCPSGVHLTEYAAVHVRGAETAGVLVAGAETAAVYVRGAEVAAGHVVGAEAAGVIPVGSTI